MSEDLRKQIRDSLEQKDTAELVEIWQANDRVEWVALTFEVLSEVLSERLGELPPQGEPVYQHIKKESIRKDKSESFLYQRYPLFYDPKEVIGLSKWANRAAIAAAAAVIITNIFSFQNTQGLVLYLFRSTLLASYMAWLLTSILAFFFILLESILFYVPLKGLSVILRILMDLEFNSRSRETGNPYRPEVIE